MASRRRFLGLTAGALAAAPLAHRGTRVGGDRAAAIRRLKGFVQSSELGVA